MEDKIKCVFIDDLDENGKPKIEYVGLEARNVIHDNYAYAIIPSMVIIKGDNIPTLYYRLPRLYPVDIDYLMKSYGEFLSKEVNDSPLT